MKLLERIDLKQMTAINVKVKRSKNQRIEKFGIMDAFKRMSQKKREKSEDSSKKKKPENKVKEVVERRIPPKFWENYESESKLRKNDFLENYSNQKSIKIEKKVKKPSIIPKTKKIAKVKTSELKNEVISVQKFKQNTTLRQRKIGEKSREQTPKRRSKRLFEKYQKKMLESEVDIDPSDRNNMTIKKETSENEYKIIINQPEIGDVFIKDINLKFSKFRKNYRNKKIINLDCLETTSKKKNTPIQTNTIKTKTKRIKKPKKLFVQSQSMFLKMRNPVRKKSEALSVKSQSSFSQSVNKTRRKYTRKKKVKLTRIKWM